MVAVTAVAAVAVAISVAARPNGDGATLAGAAGPAVADRPSRSPLTLSYAEAVPCAPTAPRRQTRLRPRAVKRVRPKVRPRLTRVVARPHRRALPATLAELAHPTRCEVVRSSPLYLPADDLAPPIVLASAPVVGALESLPPPPILDSPLIARGGPLLPEIPPIIAGGSRTRRLTTGGSGPPKASGGSTDSGGSTGSGQPRGPGIPPGSGGSSGSGGTTGGGVTPVSAAPEPEQWAFYTVGVGLLGLMLRARRPVPAKARA